jgi:hypothetical protein
MPTPAVVGSEDTAKTCQIENATSNGVLGDIGSSGHWDGDLARRHRLSTNRHNYVGMGSGRVDLPCDRAETDRLGHAGQLSQQRPQSTRAARRKTPGEPPSRLTRNLVFDVPPGLA